MILHSSAPTDLEHNVASQQTNVAIIRTLSSQPSACSMPSSLRASNAHILITVIPKAQQATISLSHILEKLKVKLRQTRLKKKKSQAGNDANNSS